MEIPDDLTFGTTDNKGELLAALSTAGLMEYLNLRYTVEYDYLGDLITSVHTRREALLDAKAKLKSMGEDLGNRRRVLQRLEEDVRSLSANTVQDATELSRKPTTITGNKVVRSTQQVAKREYKLSGGMFGGGVQEAKEKNGNGSTMKQATGKVDPRSLIQKKLGGSAKEEKRDIGVGEMDNGNSVEAKDDGEEDEDQTDDTLKDAEALEEY